MERATGIEPVLPTWESELPSLYFHHLQNRSGKINVHATLTVHAMPDLRVAAGRFADCDHKPETMNSELAPSCDGLAGTRGRWCADRLRMRRPDLPEWVRVSKRNCESGRAEFHRRSSTDNPPSWDL